MIAIIVIQIRNSFIPNCDPHFVLTRSRSGFYSVTAADFEMQLKFNDSLDCLFQRSKSNMTRLTVENVQPTLSGKYSCEVSAESSFHTALVSAVMDVVGE